MDIQSVSTRQNASSSAVDTTAPTDPTTAAPAADSSTVAAAASTANAPATTHQLSKGGMFLGFFQAFENKHPDEAKKILSGIADKLHADAKHATGAWAKGLESWGDKFQKAADSGDLSNLLPTAQPHAHFAARAYQQASQPPAANAPDLGNVVGSAVVPPTDPNDPAADANTEPAASTAVNSATGPSFDVVVAQSAAQSAAASGTTPPLTEAANGASSDPTVATI
jgi:hypothetical protein